MDAARLDDGLQRIGGEPSIGDELQVEHRAVLGGIGSAPGEGAKPVMARGDRCGFDQCAKGNLAGVAVQVIDAVVTGVEAMDGDMIGRDDFESPGLRVVAAGRPSCKIKDLLDDCSRIHALCGLS